MPAHSTSATELAASTSEAANRPRRSRLGRKEKAKLRVGTVLDDETPAPEAEPAAVVPRAKESWSWMPLADGTSFTAPVVFSSDSEYAFVAVGSAVKVYAVASAQLLSTLTVPSDSLDGTSRRTKVSCLLLNPSNHLQLLVASLDGLLRLWDYREGKLLRTLDLGSPIQHACGHPSLVDQLFVALVASPDAEPTKKQRDESPTELAGVYSISLKPKPLPVDSAVFSSPYTPRLPIRRMRLAQPRVVKALAVSSSGAVLVSLNPTQINLCSTANLSRGFAVQLDSPDVLTCLAFHPTENYFATGNVRGQIRMWYGVLEDGDVLDTATKGGAQRKGKGAEVVPAGEAPTAVFHWHAHPVASLAFTPNGAYLLSGGEEAVVVLWQLHTGHQEYVPRVGAPILTLSINNSPEHEQQIAARLRDGTVVFIGSQKLKISKTISGIKADPVRQATSAGRRSTRIPLAVQPFTNCLVLPAGHPSSLQFYSPSDDTQTLELEVSPSNRVSSIGDTPIEPTRVELVSFSTPAVGKGAGSYWMATLDTWINGSFAPERHIKFWRHRANGSGFTLSTRIDQPHEDAITSMTFSPSSESPLLLTTSTDGQIKVWAFVGDSWRCRTSLSYRAFAPVDAAWSHDGSMFAVAHARSVTLWSLASNSLIHAFPCPTVAPTHKVEFVGEAGTSLLVGGKHGTMAWDLLTFEETFSMAFVVSDVTTKPKSNTFVATEIVASSSRKHPLADVSNSAFVINTATPSCRPRVLPFPIRQSAWIDSRHALKTDEVSLAVVDERGDVLLVGEALSKTVAHPVSASRLPTSSAGQSRLFDDIFGAAQPSVVKAVVAPTAFSRKTSSLAVLDAPSHTLPPARLLWRSMLGDFAVEKPRAQTVEQAPLAEIEMLEAAPMELESAPVVWGPSHLADVLAATL